MKAMIEREAPVTNRPAGVKEHEVSLCLTDEELRALQELADRHGPRWRTVLFTAYENETLSGVLLELVTRPGAGNEIARLTILSRSLSPVALYYGPLG